MPGLSLWHFLAAAIMSSQVAGGLSPMRSLRQTICHVSPRSGRPYVLASGFALPVCACGYWPYAARKYGSYCEVSMFFFTKSVMSRIDPLVTASPMFCESRTGMSKFVLCAANWVKIASCHCAFGTVLTLMVTFGRVFVYSLPSSSRACAGGHSNHRNVSVVGLSDSLPAFAAALLPPPLSPPLPPHATSAAVATASAATAMTRSVDLIRSSSETIGRREPARQSFTMRTRRYGDLASFVNYFAHFLHRSLHIATVRPWPRPPLGGTSTSSTRPPARRSSRSSRPGRRTGSTRLTRRPRPPASGPPARRASAARSCCARSI